MTRHFAHVAVIDWSGAAVERPSGLAVALAGSGSAAPVLVPADGGWSRQAILDELLTHAERGSDLLIGLDLSPGFPFVDHGAYFPGWERSPPDAKALWQRVEEASAQDKYLGANGFLALPEPSRHFRHITHTGDLFQPGRGRLRACEKAQTAMKLSPSSCFNLVGAAQVGKSSLTGMRVLHALHGRIPVWPFDPIPDHGPLIVEIYTSIAAREANLRAGLSKIRDGAALDTALAALDTRAHTPLARYDDHATDAILTAAWLRRSAAKEGMWHPAGLTPQIASTEGWTFGVP